MFSFNRSSSKAVEYFLYAIVLFCLAHAVYYAVSGLAREVFVAYGFRQAQTALSVDWIVGGGPWVAYETPVLGAPWAIPFEFPTYHLIVAFAAWLGVPVAAAGRAVSFAFFVGTLWPIWILVRAIKLGPVAFLVSAALFLSSPLYLMWGRAFMIETCALFFCACWLAFFAQYLATGRVHTIVVAAIAGSLGALTKITTLPAFGLLGILLLGIKGFDWWQQGELKRRLVPIALCAVSGLVPLAIGYGWTIYSDALKAEHPIAVLITSSKMNSWNFGTWDQRLSPAFWWDTIGSKTLPDLFGYGLPFALISVATVLICRSKAAVVIAAIGGFLAAPLLFTNLHIVHTYYAVANGVLALCAVGFSLSCLIERKRDWSALFLLGVIIAGQIIYFHRTYVPEILMDNRTSPIFRVAQAVKDRTKADDEILVLGQDWSSEVAYYSQRRALTLPAWAPSNVLHDVIVNPNSNVGGRVAAIVFCKSYSYGDFQKEVDAFVFRRLVLADFDTCKLLAPDERTAGG